MTGPDVLGGPAARVIFRGKGRWLGLREPSPAGPVLLDAVTGPVVLAEPPPPPQPLSIAATPAGLTADHDERAATSQRAGLRRHLAARARVRRERVADRRRSGAAARVDALRARARAARRGLRARVRRRAGWRSATAVAPSRAPAGAGRRPHGRLPRGAAAPVGAVQDFSIARPLPARPGAAVPQPGTEHRYRVRALDEIGRSSAWLTSAPALLEKRFPPPPPVGPPSPAGGTPVTGVRARVLVRDAPDLTRRRPGAARRERQHDRDRAHVGLDRRPARTRPLGQRVPHLHGQRRHRARARPGDRA